MIVVFTDGDDNRSTITAQAAIQRAKAAGVPVYTVAQGAALTNPEFLKQLSGVSQATGGVAYAIHNPGEIRGVFESISQDLLHTYFFAFQPAPGRESRLSPHRGDDSRIEAVQGSGARRILSRIARDGL